MVLEHLEFGYLLCPDVATEKIVQSVIKKKQRIDFLYSVILLSASDIQSCQFSSV